MGEVLRFDRRRAGLRWIEPEALREALDGGEPISVVDVRGLNEFFCGLLGRLASAINVPLSALPGCIDALRARAGPTVVLVSRNDGRAAQAARALRSAGFSDVRVLRGGMERWHSLGYPRVCAPTARSAS